MYGRHENYSDRPQNVNHFIIILINYVRKTIFLVFTGKRGALDEVGVKWG